MSNEPGTNASQGIGTSETKLPKRYLLKPITTPAANTTPDEQRTLTDSATDPFIRAACEDDDGYDPYSDRREEPSLFEEDPWG
ncbi:MAG: hypothetical protein VB027_05685 [Gordonibacter sp.]|nr:hypothetical protein [Gordonibacter sp.]